jgi:hypothetical protein
MTQIREIKCPNCGEWTMWQGGLDDRCLFCGGFLESRQFSREVEKKINKQLKEEDDYLFVGPGDGTVKQWFKRSLNRVRWIVILLQIAFFIFVTCLLVIISLLPG